MGNHHPSSPSSSPSSSPTTTTTRASTTNDDYHGVVVHHHRRHHPHHRQQGAVATTSTSTSTSTSAVPSSSDVRRLLFAFVCPFGVILFSCGIFLVYVVARDLAVDDNDNDASSSSSSVVVPSSPSMSLSNSIADDEATISSYRPFIFAPSPPVTSPSPHPGGTAYVVSSDHHQGVVHATTTTSTTGGNDDTTVDNANNDTTTGGPAHQPYTYPPNRGSGLGESSSGMGGGPTEFASFMAWYAFLVACCVIPTACSYVRRRRNAREVQENLDIIRRRIEEIERRRSGVGGGGEERMGGVGMGMMGVGGGTLDHTTGGVAIGGGFGGLGYSSTSNMNVSTTSRNLNAPENRDREWEFLEGLFRVDDYDYNNDSGHASSSSSPSSIRANNRRGGRNNRTMTTNDVSSTANIILDYVEREHVRRMMRGGRLVAALKRCSLKVEERHLVPIVVVVVGGEGEGEKEEKEEGEEEDGRRGKISVVEGRGSDRDYYEHEYELARMEGRKEEEEEGGGRDVESGRTMIRNGDDDVCDIDRSNGIGSVNDGHTSGNGDVESLESDVVASRSCDGVDDARILEETIAAVGLRNDDVDDDDLRKTTSPTSAHCAVPLATTTAPRSTATNDPTDPSDANRLDDPGDDYDHDEDDNRYSALCVPSVANDDDDGPSSTTRTVPPTCAICLLQYRPGNYVTWSSNGDCRHVFHRDCILMWLLKKDDGGGGRRLGENADAGRRYLCPCCRGEFVSESLLSELVDADEETGNNADNATSTTNTVVVAAAAPQALPPRRRRTIAGTARAVADAYRSELTGNNADNATSTTMTTTTTAAAAAAPQADPRPFPQAQIDDVMQLRPGVALQLRPSIQQIRLQLQRQRQQQQPT